MLNLWPRALPLVVALTSLNAHAQVQTLAFDLPPARAATSSPSNRNWCVASTRQRWSAR